ncbi:Glycosyltransferase involved in cell wall bisynthesis [Saccharicrinis carchari]|uniref:Glycosyltransferase involved in cell wall bisynthesis n=1 Tax=Saccharicrinis carchari TaxID=1168039 RepID=A0A521EVA0_SACCC|nr:DUF1972 domain-containing protein [Saccharicrinis carchari]SMO87853.1 Glycosyltransferase involved in cell wall bisynthesis [Saccharicrinis carchari]
MNIAIIGTRGIPNYYGGFEQFAEYLAKYLVDKEHDVSVYNSHYHPYQEKTWEGVKIIHKYDPEEKIGTSGQFIYDLNCILDSRKRGFDIILQLGYTSSSIWGKLLPNKTKVVTNMDGLEWRRTKYSKKVQQFLLYAEKLGVKYSHHLVADSIGIQKYLKDKYNENSTYIPYGSHVVKDYSVDCLKEYDVTAHQYSMLIARLEPENSIEIILNGIDLANQGQSFLVIGNHKTKYGDYLKRKYKHNANIRFVGGVYDINILNNLRYFSHIYFHGHTVGGTNPSLLEAMGSGALICANDNLFNRSILGDDAVYFKTKEDVRHMIVNYPNDKRDEFVNANFIKIEKLYSWERIVSQYEELFNEVVSQ